MAKCGHQFLCIPQNNGDKLWLVPSHANLFQKGPAATSVVRCTPQASAQLVPLCPETDQLVQILRSKRVTPVKVEKLDFLLNGYSNSLKHFLVSGFSCGFRIRFVGERHSLESPNLKSALSAAANC